MFGLALACGCAPEKTTAVTERTASLDLSRIILKENSVPTIELGDDGTVLNLLGSRSEAIIQHRCGVHILQADFLRSDGQQEALISSLRYRLHMTTDNAAIAYFDQWEEFAGNLQGRALGTTQLNVTLILRSDSTVVLGPFRIRVAVEEVDRDPC